MNKSSIQISSRVLILALLIFLQNPGFSQEKIFSINSGEVMREALKLHDAGDYKKAIQAYQRIPSNDTNYSLACFELSFSAMADSQYVLAKEAAHSGMALVPNPYEHELLLQLVTICDESKQYDSAGVYLGKLMEKYPNSYRVWHSKGVHAYMQKQYDTAFAMFKKTILINPYAASSHYSLGMIASELGYPVHAMLCHGMSLMIAPGGTRSQQAIRNLYMLANLGDKVMENYDKRTTHDFLKEDYSEIESYFKAKLALESNYQIRTRLNEAIFRQLNLICEKLPSTVNDPQDMWSGFYAPLYKEFFEKKYFEAATIMMVSGLDNEYVQKLLKENKKEVEKASEIATTRLNNIGYYRSLITPEKMTESGYVFEDATMVAKGQYKEGDKSKLDGKWEYFNKVGHIKSVVHFKDGKVNGPYQAFHSNGKIKGESNFEAEKVNGESKEYFENGLLKTRAQLRNGIREGDYMEFHENGHPALKEFYKAGKREGLAVVYHATGAKHYELNYKNDELLGEATEYYKTGRLSTVTMIQNGKANGTVTEYYNNGMVYQKGTMKDGSKEGEFITYFKNGIVSSKQSYRKGKKQGVCTYYYENGKVRTEVNYDDDEQEGPSTLFDEEGRVVMKDDYKKGHLKKIIYYNVLNGQLVRVNTIDDKEKNLIKIYNSVGVLTKEAVCDRDGRYNGAYLEFHPDATISAQKQYINGDLNGEVKYFYKNGKVSLEQTYVKDVLEGHSIRYHSNGKIAQEGDYAEGVLQGYWYKYDNLGTLTHKDYYVDGNRHGNNYTYYGSGKLQRVLHWNKGIQTGTTEYDSSGRVMHQFTVVPGQPNALVEKNPIGIKERSMTLANNYLQGEEKNVYPNGKTKSVTTYKNGVIDTIRTGYYSNGTKSSDGLYLDDEREGRWIFYNRYGRLYSINHYLNGESHGVDTFYADKEQPEVETIIPYYQDERHGWMEKYLNKELLGKYHYVNGLIVGYAYILPDGNLIPEIPVENSGKKQLMKTFYRNGKLSGEVEYANGEYNGKRTLYYPDGKVFLETNYIDGEPEGEEKEYYSNGQLNTHKIYKMGELHGMQKKFSETGTLLEEENYVQGYPHGKSIFYDKNGKVLQTITNYWGKMLSIE